jgi:DNA repair protein RecO (recombination protein O)
LIVLETEALVLRRTDYGESHRMLLLATEAGGTLSAVARHARKSTRRFGGALELFTRMRARIERRKPEGAWALASAQVLAFHEGFVRDVGRLAAGSYAIELYRMLVPHEVAEPEAFDWLCRFLEQHESRLPDPVDMAGWEMALLSILGHTPRFDRCVTCGREAPARSWAHFDHASGGIVCSSCGGEGLRLGSRLRTFLIAVAGEPGLLEEDDTLLAVAREQARVVRRCMDLYIRAIADREPRSMPQLRRAWDLS